MALYTAIQIFDWLNNLPATSRILKIPFVNFLRKGSDITFWPRQIIFFGGFLIGYLIMRFG